MQNEINIQAGETYFGSSPCKIKTLLGSCVAVTVWHQRLKIGGMCHYLIAHPEGLTEYQPHIASYKYGEDALEFLSQKMRAHANMNEYKLALYGGANMYTRKASPSIGDKNVSLAKQWIKKNKLTVEEEDVLENICRTITLDLDTGEVYLRRYQQESRA
ncbi:chemotaxis protein CheD [Thalassotalea hakodatensis]|uniref:chemotaxis protein CheD n=1 Tax=Thalassotalea hakodatensis TaxID=3030492 RepID=UPI002573EC9B|nr:chemotaxis protein CheD [Thalassotalea hakodatensis]